MSFSSRAWSVPCLLVCSALSKQHEIARDLTCCGQVAGDSESQATSSTGRGGGRSLTEFGDPMYIAESSMKDPQALAAVVAGTGGELNVCNDNLLFSCGAESPNRQPCNLQAHSVWVQWEQCVA